MDKNKILDLYRHEKDERQVQCQRKALLKGMSFLVTVALTLMFFSFEFQEVPTVFYTIYILIMPIAGLSLSMRGWYDKNKFYFICISKYLYIGLFFLVFLMFSISCLWLLIW